jgi:methylmalonyl-CoA mutase N-terminal domain/subunit
VADAVDPLAGSYLIEQWTDALQAEAQRYLDRIDEMGGMVAAIEKGFPQRAIQDSAYRWQQAIERGEQVIVGVNQFKQENEPPVPVLTVDPRVEPEQVARVQALRASRDAAKWAQAMEELKRVAVSGDNLLPAVVQAARARATTGEISHALRAVFGTHQEVLVV